MIPRDSHEQPNAKRRTPVLLYVTCGLLTLAIFLVDLAIPLGVAVDVLYVAVVLLSFWAPEKKFVIVVAVILTALTIGGFFLSPSGRELWKVIANRALAVFAIWATTVLGFHRLAAEEKRARAAEEQQKAYEEVKILRGFLPICASCKKIRDDEGYWNQIEVYIRDHSEAEFSHSICPDCARKLYPEFYGDETSREKCTTIAGEQSPTSKP